ncbi:hypothetical protein BDV06DRAFT_207925 [Aspergillus oleicola]
MSAFISQLKSLITKAERLEDTFRKLAPGRDDWREIEALTSNLAGVTSRISHNVESFRFSRMKHSLSQVEKMKKDAKVHLINSTEKAQIRSVFRRNIVLIFQGAKVSPFDSQTEQHRKCITSQRCAILRELNVDGLISWAISYTPTSWSGGKMAWDVFDELVGDIEPCERKVWPPVLIDTLKVMKDMELPDSSEYEVFLKIAETPSVHQEPRKKYNRHLDLLIQPDIPPLLSDLDQYINVPSIPRQNVLNFLPQPFLDAVCASKRWADEVKTGRSAVTNCITLFCSRDTDDGLIVAKIGYVHSFRLAEQLCFGQPIATMVSQI